MVAGPIVSPLGDAVAEEAAGFVGLPCPGSEVAFLFCFDVECEPVCVPPVTVVSVVVERVVERVVEGVDGGVDGELVWVSGPPAPA